MGKGRGGFIDAMMEGARQAVACAYCICLCWGVMFIVAIYMLVTPSSRPGEVKKYNDAVAAWTSTGYKNFKKTAPADIKPAGTYKTSSESAKLNDDGSDIESYSDYLKIVETGVQPGNSVNWGGRTFGYGPKTIDNQDIQTIYKMTKKRTKHEKTKSRKSYYDSCPSGTTTTNENGTIPESDGKYCTARFLLKNYCVIAKVDSDGSLESQDKGLNGCYPTKDQSNHAWAGLPGKDGVTFALYESVGITTRNDPTTKVEFRSQSDPYLIALQITNGSLNFGLTKGQMLTISLVLFILCGVMCIPCYCICFVICHPSRRETMLGRARYGNQWSPPGGQPIMNNNQYGGESPPPQPQAAPYSGSPQPQQPYGNQPYGTTQPAYGQPPPQGGGYHDIGQQQPQPGYPVYPPTAPPAPMGYQQQQAYPDPIKP